MAILRLLATLTFGITVSTPTTFTPGPPTQSTSTLVANPNTAVANGTASMPLTFTAVDTYGNLAPGVAITLSASGGNNTFGATSGTTNASGVFATTLTSTYAQTEVIAASFGSSSSVTTIVQFVPGAASSATSSLVLSPNSQIANNSNTITASLTLKDAKGNAIFSVTPTFTASGTSTTVSAPAATSASGQSSATYQTTLAQNENALVTAGGLSFIAPMVFVAGPPAVAASTLAASPNIAAGNGSAAISLVTTARDAQGNAVSGASVALSASGGNNTFTASNGNTTAGGTYMTTLKSTVMQTETITALIAGSINKTVSVTFTGNANATTSSLAISPNTQTVGPGNVITATLNLRDAASNALSGVSPTWSGSGGNNTISSGGATSTSGVSTATYSSTLAQNENATVSAGGISLFQPISYTAGSPNAATSYIYAIPTRQVANNSNIIMVSAMFYDMYSNPVSGQTATFAASGSNTTVSGPATSNSMGLAQASYQSGTIQNENATVSAGGFMLATSVIFTDIPINCVLVLNPNTATADGNSALGLTATLTNSNGQPVPNVQTIFSSSGAAQSFSNQNVVTTSLGQATNTLTSLYAGSDTVLAQAANVQCVAQGNFLMRTGYCTGNPNYYSSTFATGTSPLAIAAADFNGDGNQDIAVTNYGGNTIGIFLNIGAGKFQNQVVYPSGAAPSSLIAADLNNDGKQDIVVANASSNTLGVFLGSGNGILQLQTAYATDASPGRIVAEDFNSDGILDIVVINSGSNSFGLFLGTGLGSFQTQISYVTSAGPTSIATGDFNGDGKQDIAVVNRNINSLGVFLGTRTASFSAQVTYATSKFPNDLATGDFNGDGYQDIVTVNSGASTVGVFVGNGSGGFQNQVTYPTGNYPVAIVVGDLNGDSKQDLLVKNKNDSTFGILLGTGSATFQTQVAYAVSPSSTSLTTFAIGDYNGDGKQDVAASNSSNNTVSVFLTSCP